MYKKPNNRQKAQFFIYVVSLTFLGTIFGDLLEAPWFKNPWFKTFLRSLEMKNLFFLAKIKHLISM